MLSNSAPPLCYNLHGNALNLTGLSFSVGNMEMLTPHTSPSLTEGWDLHIWDQSTQSRLFPSHPTACPDDAIDYDR